MATKNMVFQLPLSGSQYNFTNHRLLDTDSNFQLPLSGSHTSLIMNLSPSGRTLSTPSLGITFALLAYPCDKHSFLLSTPSLGITGSRQLDILGLNAVSNCFQLPLSGSLKWEGERARVMYWTFNSLSRDHGRIPGTVKRVVGAPLSTPSLGITGSLALSDHAHLEHVHDPFNSLSRDHDNFRHHRYFGWQRMALSTPSLGITSRRTFPSAFKTVSMRRLSIPLSGSHHRICRERPARPEVYFQLPLSGSLRPRTFLVQGESQNFQLPLSGSRVAPLMKTSMPMRRAFNSLSRDHMCDMYKLYRLGNRVAFNSLSRDHSRGGRFAGRNSCPQLSTPSLGITGLARGVPPQKWCPNFQLPLSGSHNTGGSQHRQPALRFQLPLSGSQNSHTRKTWLPQPEPFNSLSRDHQSDVPIVVDRFTPSFSFNSLSRDHSDSFWYCCF